MGQNLTISDDIIVMEIVVCYTNDIMNHDGITRSSFNNVLTEVNEVKSNVKDLILPHAKTNKILVVFCNTYSSNNTSEKHRVCSLGESTLNDGLLIYNKFDENKYSKYLFIELTVKEFEEKMKESVSFDSENLVIFFAGHGTYSRINRFNPETNKNEKVPGTSFMLDDKSIPSYMVEEIINNGRFKHAVLIADCCHSAYIYGRSFINNNVLTIGACEEKDKSVQQSFNIKSHGLFTYYFCSYLFDDNVVNLKTLKERIDKKARIYGNKQKLIYNTECDIEL